MTSTAHPPDDGTTATRSDPRLLAFYLPQVSPYPGERRDLGHRPHGVDLHGTGRTASSRSYQPRFPADSMGSTGSAISTSGSEGGLSSSAPSMKCSSPAGRISPSTCAGPTTTGIGDGATKTAKHASSCKSTATRTTGHTSGGCLMFSDTSGTSGSTVGGASCSTGCSTCPTRWAP